MRLCHFPAAPRESPRHQRGCAPCSHPTTAAALRYRPLDHVSMYPVRAAAVRFLGISRGALGNLWWLSNNPEIANFQTGAPEGGPSLSVVGVSQHSRQHERKVDELLWPGLLQGISTSSQWSFCWCSVRTYLCAAWLRSPASESAGRTRAVRSCPHANCASDATHAQSQRRMSSARSDVCMAPRATCNLPRKVDAKYQTHDNRRRACRALPDALCPTGSIRAPVSCTRCAKHGHARLVRARAGLAGVRGSLLMLGCACNQLARRYLASSLPS